MIFLYNGEKYTESAPMLLTDIVWWEQLYNCLCRELEDIKQKKETMS